MAAKKRIEVVQVGYQELLEYLGFPKDATVLIRGLNGNMVPGGRLILPATCQVEVEYKESNWIEHELKARTPPR